MDPRLFLWCAERCCLPLKLEVANVRSVTIVVRLAGSLRKRVQTLSILSNPLLNCRLGMALYSEAGRALCDGRRGTFLSTFSTLFEAERAECIRHMG